MIVSKAKDYLAAQGINPDNLLRKFNIRVLGEGDLESRLAELMMI